MSDNSTKMPGFLSQISHRFGAPLPIVGAITLFVDPSQMSGYFGSVWDSLSTVTYPAGSVEALDVISKEKFIRVCQYLTTARLDNVYSNFFGREVERIVVPDEYEMPKCVADVINSIGVVTIVDGAVVVIPQANEAPNLSYVVCSDDVRKFSSLTSAAASRGLIRTAAFSRESRGSAWWLLSARRAADRAAVAADDDAVQVVAAFREWTPADATLCAIVQRRFDGVLPGVLHTMLWSCGSVRDVALMRDVFNIKA